MNYSWKDAEHNCHYYFKDETGLIVGQVYNIAHTKIWGTRIYLNGVEEKYIGNYITVESAKGAIQTFWDIQERTLLE